MYNYVHTLNIRNVLAGRRLDAENAIVIFSVGESFFFCYLHCYSKLPFCYLSEFFIDIFIFDSTEKSGDGGNVDFYYAFNK